jgi:hypothetical protein
MAYLYLSSTDPNPSSINRISPDVITLHQMFRVTLDPRIGDASTIPSYERNLIDAIKKQEAFHVFDYILQEIWNVAVTTSRACSYAPFIMSFIEHVIG